MPREESSSRVVVEQPELRRSKRVRKSKEIDSRIISFYLVEGNRESFARKIPIILLIEDDPKTYNEAVASRDSAFWKDAIQDEMDSIMSNHTWEIVDQPKGSRPIG